MAADRQYDDARGWLEDIGIDVVEVCDRSWPGSDTHVIQVIQSNGARLFLKQFNGPDRFAREVNAYENWVSDFDGCVPSLVFVDEPRLRFLMSDVGDCCPWEGLSPHQQARVQFRAGRFLRRLHEIEFSDDDQMPIGNAVLLRARAAQERIVRLQSTGGFDVCDGINADEVKRIVAGVEGVLPLLNRCKRVPCHRDFWRRNWIWGLSEGGASNVIDFRVIDFEHARPDLFLLDMMKNWSDCWLGSARLESAFWDGYGRTLDDDERLLLCRCGALHAAQTILWAHEHRQVEFLSQGLALLAAATRM